VALQAVNGKWFPPCLNSVLHVEYSKPKHLEPRVAAVPGAAPKVIQPRIFQPGTQPTQPAYPPGEPMMQPTQPAYSPGEPVMQPTPPAYPPCEPRMQPTQPAYPPGEPRMQPHQPAYPPPAYHQPRVVPPRHMPVTTPEAVPVTTPAAVARITPGFYRHGLPSWAGQHPVQAKLPEVGSSSNHGQAQPPWKARPVVGGGLIQAKAFPVQGVSKANALVQVGKRKAAAAKSSPEKRHCSQEQLEEEEAAATPQWGYYIVSGLDMPPFGYWVLVLGIGVWGYWGSGVVGIEVWGYWGIVYWGIGVLGYWVLGRERGHTG